MARPKKPTPPTPVPFTGMARTVQCFNHNGWQNFRVVTLVIENGIVVQEFKSDPYLMFEAAEKLDLYNDYACLRLNMSWEDGKAWFLKKDKDGNLMEDKVSG